MMWNSDFRLGEQAQDYETALEWLETGNPDLLEQVYTNPSFNEIANYNTALPLMEYAIPDEYFLPPMALRDEDNTRVADIKAVLDPYKLQVFAEFITGTRDIETDRDAYLAELDAEKERKETHAMIYRDERHQHTFEKEAAMRPDTVSRALLAALYLLTADRNLWSQVKDHISLRRMYVEDMRPKNLTGTSYVYFAAAKDILTGTRNIQLMEIADPALLSMKSYMILCTALAIRAYGVERASRIQFEARWE